jgi:hypothetical protein
MNGFARLFAAKVSWIRDGFRMRIEGRSVSTSSVPTRRSPLRIRPLRCGLAVAFALSLSAAEAAYAQSIITADQTVVTLESFGNPVAAGGSITLAASVTTTQGGGVPGGTIQFIDETTMAVLGWADVATPSITVRNLTAGRHLIRADYSGTADFLPLMVQPSRSELLTLTVPVTPDVTVSSSQNPSVPGQLVTLTAMVTSRFGTPKGSVTFSDGRSVIAAHVGLDRSGIASFTTSALTDGPRAIIAVYEGDGEHASAVSQRLVQNVGVILVSNTVFR